MIDRSQQWMDTAILFIPNMKKNKCKYQVPSR